MKSKFNSILNRVRNHFFWNRFKRLLPTNPIIIEAGANNGSDTIKMANLWPQGIIYSFEPVPDLFKKLKQNTIDYNNIHIYQMALSDKVESQEMFLSAGNSNGSSSLLPPKCHLQIHPDVTFEKKCIVESLTINEFAKTQKLDKVDFIWLDIQGMEIQVLKNGLDILNKTKGIFLEVNYIENYEGCCMFDEAKEWLYKQNFHIAWKGKQYKDAGNILFLKKE